MWGREARDRTVQAGTDFRIQNVYCNIAELDLHPQPQTEIEIEVLISLSIKTNVLPSYEVSRLITYAERIYCV